MSADSVQLQYNTCLQNAREAHVRLAGGRQKDASHTLLSAPLADTLLTSQSRSVNDDTDEMDVTGALDRTTDAATAYTTIRDPGVDYFLQTFTAAATSARQTISHSVRDFLNCPTGKQGVAATRHRVCELLMSGYGLSALLGSRGRIVTVSNAFAGCEQPNNASIKSFDFLAGALSLQRRCCLCEKFFCYSTPSFCTRSSTPLHPDVSRACAPNGALRNALMQHTEAVDDFVEFLRLFKRDELLAYASMHLTPVVFQQCRLRLASPPLAEMLPNSSVFAAYSSFPVAERENTATSYALTRFVHSLAVPLTMCEKTSLYAKPSRNGEQLFPASIKIHLIDSPFLNAGPSDRPVNAFLCDKEKGDSRNIQAAVESFLNFQNAERAINNHRIVVSTYEALQRFRHAFHLPFAPALRIDLLEVYVRCIMSNAQFDDARWGHASGPAYGHDTNATVDDASLFIPFAVIFTTSFRE